MGRKRVHRWAGLAAAILVALGSTMPASVPAYARLATGIGTTQPGAAPAFGVPTAPICLDPYHQVEYVTGTADKVDHNCGRAGTAYEGWVGINGRITTPLQASRLSNVATDHVVGSIGMADYDGFGIGIVHWVHIGWYAGTIRNCPTIPNGQYAMFVEWNTPTLGHSCFRVSALSLGQEVTYRIQYEPRFNCWTVYYHYDRQIDSICGEFPRSMAARVLGSLYNASGGSRVMPTSIFGAADPNSNAALRLLGAGGYEPWDRSLRAGGTLEHDERNGTPARHFISAYAPFYHAITFSRSP